MGEKVSKQNNIIFKNNSTLNDINNGQGFAMLGLSLTIVRNSQNKYICINEVKNRGWWIPGGRVDPPEDFITAAKRECKEEAGIDVDIKGILRINESFCGQGYMRMKVIFYAEPIDEKQPLKSQPDQESLEARWVTVKEFQELCSQPQYKMRGEELIEYGNYIDQGGIIFPLDVLENFRNKQNIFNNNNYNKQSQEEIELLQKNQKLKEEIQNLISQKIQ